MKVMIVDDEVLLRIAIRSIVEKHYTVVGEASNAEQALAMAERLQPDVVLVDIVMPGLDGLELITRMSAVLRHCRYVILSNVENLDYCKRAIRNGVSDYLLKSETNEQTLPPVLGRIADEIKKERVLGDDARAISHIDQYLVLIEFLRHAVSETAPSPERIRAKLGAFHVHIRENRFYLLIVQSGSRRLEGLLHLNTVLTICQEIVRDMGEGVTFLNENNRISILYSDSLPAEEETVRHLAHRIIQTLMQYFAENLDVGISAPTAGFERLSGAYRQALQSLNACFYLDSPAIQGCRPAATGSGEDIAGSLLHTLSLSYPQQRQLLMEETEHLYQAFQHRQPGNIRSVKGIYTQIALHAVKLFAQHGVHLPKPADRIAEELEGAGKLRELHALLTALLDELYSRYQQANPLRNRQLLRQIQRRVTENLADASLDRVARDVFMSPAYVSRFFKKETGGTLHRYILELRLEKAKELLARGHTIKQITQEVGFGSESYFIKCFKMGEGVTPGQYVRKWNS